MVSGPILGRVDLNDNSIRHVPVSGLQSFHSSVAVGEDAVWLLDDGTTMYKIDPQKEQVLKEVPVEQERLSTSLGVGEGAVWVIPDSKKLTRYSATSGIEEATVPLPSHSSSVLAAFGSAWVSGTGNDELYRIDPTNNQIAATIELRARPTALVAGEGSVWVSNEGDGTVQRIDGKNGKQLATDTVGRATMTVGGGFVWANNKAGVIIQIDPRTNSVRGKFKHKATVDANFAIGYGGNSLWICGEAAYRIATPK